jgi:phosphomannomutase
MLDPNKICYIFDVDGTLTEPRREITSEDKHYFLSWSENKQCFISTGSDFSKTKEQLGQEVLERFDLIFCCMGNEARKRDGSVTRRVNFMPPKEMIIDLEDFLEFSSFPYRTDTHFEPRSGMLNFSIVGRGASQDQRREYTEWDKNTSERIKIANFINKKYPEVEASVGGSISIDIITKGKDKGQVINCLENMGAKKIVFVGDRCFPGGNDYGMIRELKKSKLAFEWYNVTTPKETFELLRDNKVFLEEK